MKRTDITVRFRSDNLTAAMKLPTFLKDKGALRLGNAFFWESLGKALSAPKDYPFQVTAVGTEGTPVGSELVVHVA
jgi:hypothetical protein